MLIDMRLNEMRIPAAVAGLPRLEDVAAHSRRTVVSGQSPKHLVNIVPAADELLERVNQDVSDLSLVHFTDI